ncbi:MAG: tetratricopeptide repeat protein [Bryobacteraceae bacterium]
MKRRSIEVCSGIAICLLFISLGTRSAPADETQDRQSKRIEKLRQANRERPDDLDTYAELADALRAAGRQEEAIETVQWMLNLRPTDVRGLWRAALIREDVGDLEGSADLMAECYRRTSPGDAGKRIEFLTGLARVFKKQGKLDDSRQVEAEAEKLKAQKKETQ